MQTGTCSVSQPEPHKCPRASFRRQYFWFIASAGGLCNPSVFLLAGQSGLGKSTLMNTLFKSKVSRKSVLATAQEKIPKTVEIKSISHGMEVTKHT